MKVGGEIWEFSGIAEGENLAEATENFKNRFKDNQTMVGVFLKTKLVGYRQPDSTIAPHKPAPAGTKPWRVISVAEDTAEVVRVYAAILIGSRPKTDPKGGSDILPKGSYRWEEQNWKPIDT